MSVFNKKVSLLFLLDLFIITTTFSMNAEAAKIDIYNYVGSGLNFIARCQPEDMLGLLAQRIPFKFGFFEVIDESVVSCTFEWFKDRHSFDIYIPDRDKCLNCVWALGPGGPCLQLYTGQKCYAWKD